MGHCESVPKGLTVGTAMAALLYAALVAVAPAHAQEDLSVRVEAAAACYARFDYDCVIERLGQLDVRAAALTEPRWVVELAVRVTAVAFVVRGVPERGRALFYELLAVFPSYHLEGEELSPRFHRVFEEARAMHHANALAGGSSGRAIAVAERLGAAREGRTVGSGVRGWARALAMTAPADARAPARGAPVVQLGVGLSAQLLFGDDAASYSGAVGASGRLALGVVAPVLLEVGIDWHRHDVEATDLVAEVSVLTALTFSGVVLYRWRVGRFSLAPGLAVGYTAFGFGSPFDRGGLAVDGLGRGHVALAGGFGVELEGRWRTVVAAGRGGETVASSPLLIGVRLTFEWPSE
jgi:hypothetical protein